MGDPNTKFCAFRLPLPMAEKVDEILRTESLQMTEYVRDLVRKDLRKRGLLVPVDGEPSAAEVGS